MYYYILDQHNLSLDKFERLQTELQSLLTEFKVSGETARVTPLRSVSDLVDTASQRGVKTLVACGTDDTFNLMLAALKGRDFTLGFIPLDENSYLRSILGIGDLKNAVKTIAARRIERIDLARINGNYFISYLEFGVMSKQLKSAGWWNGLKLLSSEPVPLVVRIDNSYNVSITALGGLAANIRSVACSTRNVATPTDGNLDLLIMEPLTRTEMLMYRQAIAEGCLEKVPKTTVIKCKRIDFLEPKGHPLSMLGRIITKFPATVEIIPQRLKMIVGKNRTF